MVLVGYIAAVLSAVFNGSFTSPYKIERVAKFNLHPILFTQYVSIGAFLSSMLVIPFLPYNKYVTKVDDDDVDDRVATDFVFSWLGVVAGALLVVALGASFLAIEKIGVALAQGTFGGTAIIVSYIWGTVIFGEAPSNVALSVCGLLLLIAGVLCIAMTKNITAVVFPAAHSAASSSQEHLLNASSSSFSDPGTRLSEFKGDEDAPLSSSSASDQQLVGIAWALLVGFSGGSILAPSHYTAPEEGGLAFIPSFGLGAMLASPLLTLCWFGLYERRVPEWNLQQCLPVGIFSGTLWNISNALAVVAIPELGYGVAYPLLQCALFVAGIWGIVLFDEIRGREVAVFFASGLGLIAGAVMVAIAS
jgi:multidrug transporter EmrE-like cation transporter